MLVTTAHVRTCALHLPLKLAPPPNFLYVATQLSGSSYLLSRLKRVSSGVIRMLSDSFRTSSMVLLARCKTFVPVQFIGWSFVHACSAMADLSVRHFTHASLCFLILVSSLRLVSPMYTLLQVHGTSYTTFRLLVDRQGVFCLSE